MVSTVKGRGFLRPFPALCPAESRVPDLAARSAFLLLICYVLILPVAHTIALRNVLFFSLVALTAWGAVRWRLELRLPWAPEWLIYLAVALASLPTAIDPLDSANEIKHEIVFGAAAGALGAIWLRHQADFDKVIAVLVVGSAIMGLWAGLQAVRDWTGGYPFDPAQRGALLSGVGSYSTYIVLLAPFLFYLLLRHRSPPMRFALISILVLNVIGALATMNRAVFPALAAEVLVFGYLAVRASERSAVWLARMATGVVFVAILGAFQFLFRDLANPDGSMLSADPRFLIWSTAVDNIRAAPWFGSGFGREAFRRLNPDMVAANDHFWHAHNVLLNKGVQMGIPGILAFALLMLAACRSVWLNRAEVTRNPQAGLLSAAGLALIAGMLTKNMTDDFLVRDQGYLFWLLLAAASSVLGLYRAGRDRE